jgi:hypothetical protein
MQAIVGGTGLNGRRLASCTHQRMKPPNVRRLCRGIRPKSSGGIARQAGRKGREHEPAADDGRREQRPALHRATGARSNAHKRLRLTAYALVCIVTHMERTNIFLPLRMKAELRKLSKASGVPIAELVRRAINSMLAKQC